MDTTQLTEIFRDAILSGRLDYFNFSGSNIN